MQKVPAVIAPFPRCRRGRARRADGAPLDYFSREVVIAGAGLKKASAVRDGSVQRCKGSQAAIALARASARLHDQQLSRHDPPGDASAVEARRKPFIVAPEMPEVAEKIDLYSIQFEGSKNGRGIVAAGFPAAASKNIRTFHVGDRETGREENPMRTDNHELREASELRALNRRRFLEASAACGVASLVGMPVLGLDTGSALAQAAPKRGGVLKAAFSADPAGFDPVRGPSGMSHVVIEQIYSTLMALDPDAKPYPELAEGYEISPDGLQYTFKLRQGVTFHSGDELTADDVKFSFDRLRAKGSGYSYGSQVETIDSVDALDKQTVRFRLTKRTGPFLIYMAFPGSSIVPKKLVEAGHDLNAKPIGSGPFKFESYEPRSAIRFKRNDSYLEQGKPYFDAMEYRIISDVTALTDAVMSGAVNFSNEIPPKDWAAVSSNPDLKAVTLEGSHYYWLLPNNTHPPMDNPKVRQAIGLAIDRKAIVQGGFFGLATPILGGVIPKWNWGYDDTQFFKQGSDVAGAKKLLAEAGHPDGFTTTMTIASSFPAMVAMAPIIQANLAAVGIKATIGTMEIPRYWDEVWSPSKFDITTMYWLSPLADPDDFVYNNYKCGMAINVQKTCSEAMDSILEEAKTAPTQEARKELYKKMQELSMQEMDIVPLVNAWLLIAHVKSLQGFRPMRTGFLKTLKDSWFES